MKAKTYIPKIIGLFAIFNLFFSLHFTYGQQDQQAFYATMALQDAKDLKDQHPDKIEILAEKHNEVAVLLSEGTEHILHQNVVLHGPGYIYRESKEDAINALSKKSNFSKVTNPGYSITEDDVVLSLISLVNAQNIENQIKELEAYGTRFHNTDEGFQSASDLKTKWEAMAASYNREDVSVRLVEHESTPMPSVVLTIEGKSNPDQYVIIGGHLDSTSREGNDFAPGADDDASGIATITEITRVLFEGEFFPSKTIEVMAYAAEEIGLKGSREIASDYSDRNVNVYAVAQFDMTNYQGSANDIYFVEDDKTDPTLNAFMKSLLDHYNKDGEHAITYSSTRCGYPCSDHASWDENGYRSTFPFEASFANSNPNIHTASDTYTNINSTEHAMKFAKLGVEFVVETAKGESTLSTGDFEKEGFDLYVVGDILNYDLGNNQNSLLSIDLFDIHGRKVLQNTNPSFRGNISLSPVATGVYIITFTLDNNEQISSKIVVN